MDITNPNSNHSDCNTFLHPSTKALSNQYQDPTDEGQDRTWQLTNLNPSLPSPPNAKITLKIRGEEAENFVPEKLYSSHKYYVTHEVSGISHDMCSAKLVVEDPITNQEIRSKDGKIIVKHINSTLEPTLTKPDFDKPLTGEMRIQFTSSSYKFGKGYFRMSFTYHTNTGERLFTLQSPPFRVYARKTSTDTQTLAPGKKKISGKRKRKSDKNSSPNPSSKKVKISSGDSASMDSGDQAYVPPGGDNAVLNSTTQPGSLPFGVTNPRSDFSLQQQQSNQNQAQLWGFQNKNSSSNPGLQLPSHMQQTQQEMALKGPDVLSQPNSFIPSADNASINSTTNSSQTHLFSQFQEKLQHLMAIHQHIKKPDQERARAESLDKLYSVSPQIVQSALGSTTNNGNPIHQGMNSTSVGGGTTTVPSAQQNNGSVNKNNSLENLHYYSNFQFSFPQQQQQSNQNQGQNAQKQHIQPATNEGLSQKQQSMEQKSNDLFSLPQRLNTQSTTQGDLQSAVQTGLSSIKDQSKDLILDDPRPLFLAEAQKNGGKNHFKSFSPLISTPKLLEEDLKLKTPTDELLRSVKSPDNFEGFGAAPTPSIVDTPSEFFASPSVFNDPHRK